jgi:hypothetical protein
MDYLLGGDVRGDCDDIDEDGGALDEEDEEEEGEEEEETKERRGALGASVGPAHETRAYDSRVVLEIGCGSGSSCLPIIQRYRDAISRGGGMRRRCASYANDTTGSCHGGGTSDETRHGGMARCRHRRRRTRGADRGIAVLLACDSSPVAVSTTRRLVVVDDDDDIYAGSTGGGCHDRTEEDDNANHRNHRRRLMAFEAFVADPSLTDNEETGVVVGTDVVDDYHDGTTFPSRVFSAYERAMSKIGGGEDDELGGGLGAERDIAFEGGRGRVVGVVLMIFVLSAVVPRRVRRFLDRVFEITNAGGRVCFRDYGRELPGDADFESIQSPFLTSDDSWLIVPPSIKISSFFSPSFYMDYPSLIVYDMPMLRFDPSASRGCADVTTVTDDNGYSNHVGDPVFVRGEGTIARFFSVDAVRSLFESVGFETLELRYCTVYNRNRKTGQEMKRVFVHGVFLKP